MAIMLHSRRTAAFSKARLAAIPDTDGETHPQAERPGTLNG